MRLALVGVLAACGSAPAPPATTGNVAATSEPERPGPKPLGPGTTLDIDFDADGTLEQLSVGGEPGKLTLLLYHRPFECGDWKAFDHVDLLDLDPKVPGVELVVSKQFGSGGFQFCYITKFEGKPNNLVLRAGTHVEDSVIYVSGTCGYEPTAYVRTTRTWEEKHELSVGKGLPTRPDCP